MTSAQFHAAALDIFQNYWRTKASNALYRSSQAIATGRLDYENVPAVGLVRMPFPTESVADAMSAMNDFVAKRLPRDLFLALIAEFESRLVTRLLSLGDTGQGTLGQLQTRLEHLLPVQLALSEDLKELRERRNAMIHHGDFADAKYVTASNAVLPRAAPYLQAVAVGDNVSPTDVYLPYAADVLVRYSNAIC